MSGEQAKQKLWGGRFTGKIDPLLVTVVNTDNPP